MRKLTWAEGQIGAFEPDPGLLYGRGVFETIPVVYGACFSVDDHLARMVLGAQKIGVPPPPPHTESVIRALVSRVKDEKFVRLRLTLTPGADGEGALVATVEPYEPPQSVRAMVSPYIRNERSAITGVKATAYIENLLAIEGARGQGAEEPLLGNSAGFLSEGATSNVFLEKDGVIYTPPLDSGCLPGITRMWCLRIATQAGVHIREENVSMLDLAQFDHLAVTSALKGVSLVSSLDGEPREPGPMLSVLKNAFENHRKQYLKRVSG